MIASVKCNTALKSDCGSEFKAFPICDAQDLVVWLWTRVRSCLCIMIDRLEPRTPDNFQPAAVMLSVAAGSSPCLFNGLFTCSGHTETDSCPKHGLFAGSLAPPQRSLRCQRQMNHEKSKSQGTICWLADKKSFNLDPESWGRAGL